MPRPSSSPSFSPVPPKKQIPACIIGREPCARTCAYRSRRPTPKGVSTETGGPRQKTCLSTPWGRTHRVAHGGSGVPGASRGSTAYRGHLWPVPPRARKNPSALPGPRHVGRIPSAHAKTPCFGKSQLNVRLDWAAAGDGPAKAQVTADRKGQSRGTRAPGTSRRRTYGWDLPDSGAFDCARASQAHAPLPAGRISKRAVRAAPAPSRMQPRPAARLHPAARDLAQRYSRPGRMRPRPRRAPAKLPACLLELPEAARKTWLCHSPSSEESYPIGVTSTTPIVGRPKNRFRPMMRRHGAARGTPRPLS